MTFQTVTKLICTKLSSLLLGLILVSGCLPKYPETVLAQSRTPQFNVEPKQTETSPVISIQTKETIAATSSPNSTLTVPTLSTTLSPEEREQEIADLLNPDKNCRLPCWWSFNPGNALWVDVNRFLLYLNAPIFNYPSDQDARYATEVGRPDKTYSLQVDFLVRQDQVVGIVVRSADNFDLAKFQKDWEQYQPIRILQEYGTPSRIWIETSGIENNGLIGALLFFFYDKQGFLIVYQSGAVVTPNSYRFCPQIETAINLFLQSPDNSTSLDILAKDLIDSQYIDTIEQATGKTIEESSKNMLETGCFETAKSIGP